MGKTEAVATCRPPGLEAAITVPTMLMARVIGEAKVSFKSLTERVCGR
jgi:hypothetical protein